MSGCGVVPRARAGSPDLVAALGFGAGGTGTSAARDLLGIKFALQASGCCRLPVPAASLRLLVLEKKREARGGHVGCGDEEEKRRERKLGRSTYK